MFSRGVFRGTTLVRGLRLSVLVAGLLLGLSACMGHVRVAGEFPLGLPYVYWSPGYYHTDIQVWRPAVRHGAYRPYYSYPSYPRRHWRH